MTEAEWLACTNPDLMLAQLGDRLTDRKARLYAAAYARSFWDLLGDERSRQAVQVAERYADGQATAQELLLAYNAAVQAWAAIPEYNGSRRAMRRSEKGRAAEKTAAWVARYAADPTLAPARLRFAGAGHPKWLAFLAGVLRDLFGPRPALPACPNPGWLAGNGGAASALAATINEAWSVEHLSVLADALEDAGCDDADLVSHLRSQGPHVRGCWAVDLCLGKT